MPVFLGLYSKRKSKILLMHWNNYIIHYLILRWLFLVSILYLFLVLVSFGKVRLLMSYADWEQVVELVRYKPVKG